MSIHGAWGTPGPPSSREGGGRAAGRPVSPTERLGDHMVQQMRHRLARGALVHREFPRWGDLVTALRLHRAVVKERKGEPLPMHPRFLGGIPVLSRPGTADWRTLIDVFVHQYHMPREPLTDPAWILDLGANVGYTAACFLHAYPSARVLAVEMETAALYTLAARFAANALTVLTVSDDLVTGEATSSGDRETSFTDMMRLALETCVLL